MLSRRGAQWATIGFAHGEQNNYNAATNPKGIVSFANAENSLMHDDLTGFINEHNDFDKRCCAYGEGYTGTLCLRRAMAAHLNAHFHPANNIGPEEITFAAGVTYLNEASTLILCDPDQNDGIMLGRPVYGAFARDLAMRTNIHLEYVSVGDTDQFSPSCVAGFESGFEAAKARGTNIKALMICNPHNPLGRCYSRETLIGLLRLCASKGIHLISDEIYALSVYERHDRESETFTSIRAIDPTGIIDPSQVHVLYGMSKDFGASGMRLGCIISQNEEFTRATRATCRFSSPSQFSMDLATKFLEDQEFVAKFLKRSHHCLLQSRLLVEDLLFQEGISYSQKGNAGFFLWLDLSAFLPLHETGGDGWAAQRLLTDRFSKAGVIMSTGAEYRAPSPGRFRLVFCVDPDTLKEGIRR
ncbi:hypothetical protein ANOM_006713 [Aspergillus nomiae NRRL 13137]|uniref:Aminotransferase class I/classII large domain-containing protein n=1 Tax=Aspergillus nomiae NRRL (strain ATCC 15546 / NRRL 13137 / CBS 260.88 / M93) TaxID=1509407 RepID=A0A0L1J059_ASPN3|nr:uncharacterized protein ANOM_006713 [Aspergillus nomiae NRRL 13137]KNG84798.1 hypothetical protein ANOM_006713 [Aspergillus nomiae NRRL 13137]